jgi:hypothetical protein
MLSSGVVFFCHGELVLLPQPADLALGSLEHVEVHVLDVCALLHRLQDEFAGKVPLGAQERVEILPRIAPPLSVL